ncbi:MULTISPECIES: cell division protein ZapB [Geobacter]|uniref:cell division protein ZapB n=1 Tax=Geobacter TaxID=28231 RepID=UPI002574844F|nr:cell division protein ZapB [Geobacter sulfurreducens]BEH10873.1 cell division protein ZapB [Geobacter sulfurreducens subsp. ethanolicus]BET58716.1 cell division protein ZapB [Geobacter sp. 60473]HML79730.1 cell division protein ZapB [Geobacter sulfurreducens]
MDTELFSDLERRLDMLLERYGALKRENEQLRADNARLQQEREGVKVRIDGILRKLEGI